MQAAHYAVRWPRARVVGIDLSATSIAHCRELQREHGLDNIELHQLPIERAGELGESFDYVVCTGVLHHLADPGAGLRALRGVLRPSGAMHLMLYAPYGRAGVYLLQEYCRRVGAGSSAEEIRDLVASLKALPADHPIVPLLRNSPDFATSAGVADALLHPRDRAYSVPQVMTLLEGADLSFGRWIRQAAYLPECGAIARVPHGALISKLPPIEQYAALELFRGTMLRHAFVCYPSEAAPKHAVTLDSDDALDYVPIRVAETVAVRERVPQGAAAVLINRSHAYNDLYLPIDAAEERLLDAIDAKRTIAQICADTHEPPRILEFFRKLWRWDQIVFDTHVKSERP